jgi:hypothetical protein
MRKRVHMNPKNEIDPSLHKKLKSLQTIPTRAPSKAVEGRALFLKQAEETARGVTGTSKRRHIGWMQSIQSKFLFRRKEHSPMFSTFGTIMLIVALVFGGSGVTVAAAQNSMPDQLLYNLKLLSESTLLNLTSSPESQFNLALGFETRRADEILTIFGSGGVLSAEVVTRFQNQIDQAIRLALNLSDDQVPQAFEQLQTRLQTQQQSFIQVQANGSSTAEAAMIQTREMIQERLQILETGKNNYLQLRDQLQQQDQLNNRNQQNLSTPAGQGSQNAPGRGAGNPWTSGTPTPGSSYGPGSGTGDCVTCTPSGIGQGGNPYTTGTPTPGSGYGPGDQITPMPGGQGGKK